MKKFADLNEQQILALAISLEEEHGRIYADYAAGLGADYPATAKIFTEMAQEENEHRRWLIDLFRQKFGDHIPLIRRQDVSGFVRHEPIWFVRPLGLDRVRQQAEAIELETRNFYRSALTRASDAEVRKLIGDLIVAEDRHLGIAQHISEVELTPGARSAEEQAARRAFVLQYVQPGLTGLIDGSVSTLAPIFAAAFATHNTWQTFLVGLAASVGAGISMAFAEALADDGQISGRGNPWIRGAVTGLMTALGGLGHTLPYLISNFWTATSIAIAVVFVELWIIAGIRARFMETRFLRAALEVVVGGLLVFVVGILIGSA
ncbi:iron exporter MbfA [Hyphomicrobium sp.]|jgi:rubrerythrin|uniref:iron exporter MbfA n=1 Tax=Hyphomicrobium sp. TaxID=82 RepID=UPI002B58F6EE|nr:ferritin family protein [Hyphomicrobium sp.]HVZ03283.1 ferritin family protein [Hyphomicrobium sp.]